MTLAVFTTTKSEISFPTMEIMKTRLRNMMKVEFLTNIMIINIERKVNTNKILIMSMLLIASNHSMIIVEFILKEKLIQVNNFVLILCPNFQVQHMIWWKFPNPFTGSTVSQIEC